MSNIKLVCQPKTEDSSSSDDSSDCPKGFSAFLHSDGSIHCWLFDSKPKTYEIAKADCVGRADSAEIGKSQN